MNYYNDDIYHTLDKISKLSYFNEWYMIVKDILLSDEFQRRKLFRHHDGSVWEHSIDVSYRSFLLCKYYHLDTRCAAIAGLLHDFYPKAYKYSDELAKLDKDYLSDVKKKQPIHKMHGFTHANAAANNAVKFFPSLIDDKIYSCIKTHMFPLNIMPPKYIEGWIITMMDKKLSMNVIKEIKYIPGIISKRINKNRR